LLVGQGRSGKTALGRYIRGIPFEDTPSTIGLDKYDVAVSHGSMNEGIVSDYTPLASLLVESIALSTNSIDKLKRFRRYIQAMNQRHLPVTSTGNRSYLLTFWKTISSFRKESKIEPYADNSLSLSEEDNEAPDVSAVTFEETNNEGDAELRKLAENVSSNVELVISLYDFGGQDIFSVINSMFMSKNAVYFLVFDMELFLQNSDCCLKVLNFWMNLIAVHTLQEDPSDASKHVTSAVAIVGTRADVVGDLSRQKEISLHICNRFSEHICWGSLIFFDEALSFFPIDNKSRKHYPTSDSARKSDDTLKQLMSLAEQRIVSSSFLKKEVAFSWIQMLEALLTQSNVENDDDRSYVATYSAVADIARSKGMTDEDIPKALQFFSDMGMLLWLDDVNTRDSVIFNPVKFFVKPVSLIICKHIATLDDPTKTVHCEPVHQQCRNDSPDEWIRMLEFGLVSRSSAEMILKSYFKERPDHIQVILSLMEKYRLISRESTSDLFLIPSLFPGNPYLLDFPPRSDFKPSEMPQFQANSKLFRRLETRFLEIQAVYKVSTSFLFGFSISGDFLLNRSLLSYTEVSMAGFLPHGLFECFIGRIVDRLLFSANNVFKRMYFVTFKDIVEVKFLFRKVKITNLLHYNMIKIEVEESKENRSSMEKGIIVLIHDTFYEILQSLIREFRMNLSVFTLLPCPSLAVDDILTPLLPLPELKFIAANEGETQIDLLSEDALSLKITRNELIEKFSSWFEIDTIHPERNGYVNKVAWFLLLVFALFFL
jgi:GTPase SAR1 family protein